MVTVSPSSLLPPLKLMLASPSATVEPGLHRAFGVNVNLSLGTSHVSGSSLPEISNSAVPSSPVPPMSDESPNVATCTYLNINFAVTTVTTGTAVPPGRVPCRNETTINSCTEVE